MSWRLLDGCHRCIWRKVRQTVDAAPPGDVLARGGCVLRTLAAVIGIKRQDDGTLGRGKKFSLLPKKVSLHRSSHLMEQL